MNGGTVGVCTVASHERCRVQMVWYRGVADAGISKVADNVQLRRISKQVKAVIEKISFFLLCETADVLGLEVVFLLR